MCTWKGSPLCRFTPELVISTAGIVGEAPLVYNPVESVPSPWLLYRSNFTATLLGSRAWGDLESEIRCEGLNVRFHLVPRRRRLVVTAICQFERRPIQRCRTQEIHPAAREAVRKIDGGDAPYINGVHAADHRTVAQPAGDGYGRKSFRGSNRNRSFVNQARGGRRRTVRRVINGCVRSRGADRNELSRSVGGSRRGKGRRRYLGAKSVGSTRDRTFEQSRPRGYRVHGCGRRDGKRTAIGSRGGGDGSIGCVIDAGIGC